VPRKSPHRKPVITRNPLTKARTNFGAIIKRVSTDHECFILERDGLPVAALMDMDEFEDYLELHDPEVGKAVAEGRKEHLAGKSRPAGALLRELEEEEERERRPEKAVP
jgi:prevent-host-death family protein